MPTLPAIGLLNPDGTATLSREEVAWLREVFSRVSIAFGEANAAPRAYQAVEIRERTEEAAKYAAARHAATAPGVAVVLPPFSVNMRGDRVEHGAFETMAVRFRAEVTVIAGGLPPAPPQRDYFPLMSRGPLLIDVPAAEPIETRAPIFGTVRTGEDL